MQADAANAAEAAAEHGVASRAADFSRIAVGDIGRVEDFTVHGLTRMFEPSQHQQAIDNSGGATHSRFVGVL